MFLSKMRDDMKKNLVLFMALSALILAGCSKALDTVQQNVVERDTYYQNATDANAESLIAVIYREAYLLEEPLYLQGVNSMADDGNTYSTVMLTPANNNTNDYYAQYFRLNYLANLIIDKLADNSAVKKQVRGEAYFWRAWTYLNLIRGWGTPPLVDHVLASDELKMGNSTQEALWAFVKSNLETAIGLLPEKPALGAQGQIGGRVTKASAQALLGKACVLSGDYAAAVTALEGVIGSQKYKLEDDFGVLYHIGADFSDEYMWEFNASDAASVNTYHEEGDTRINRLNWNTAQVVVPGGLDSGAGALMDIDKGLYDFYVNRGEQGKPRMKGTLWSYEDVLDRFVELGLAANREDAVSKFWTSGGVTSGQGYFRSKMLPMPEDIYDFPTFYADDRRLKSNWPGMRYAEVLLLYAEACVQSGTKTGEGLNAVNEVRRRAGLDNAPELTLQLVKDEKRAELAFEGERFFDLVRWGDAPTVLANRGLYTYRFRGYVKGSTTYDVEETAVPNGRGFREGQDELFPFPYSEVLMSEGKLKQNQGW